ncbi:hypothetical protein QYE76_001223 [Lolium multiflorum]|uniref:Reverse transcriptase Ty1/copia-type domain-containing protein n=1 Tax=Lolium multiflorum TaxID=4521 RepID=A0AAD8RJC4_LOLMU|nr:hypothetical protein QYE76_001223 [Lolium multiflorum]
MYGEVKRGRVGDALDFMEKSWKCTYEKEKLHKDLRNDQDELKRALQEKQVTLAFKAKAEQALLDARAELEETKVTEAFHSTCTKFSESNMSSYSKFNESSATFFFLFFFLFLFLFFLFLFLLLVLLLVLLFLFLFLFLFLTWWARAVRNMNMNKEFPELFGMLKAAEIEIKKEHQVLMVNKTTSFKKQGKSKGKNKKSGKKAATPPVKPKSGPKPMLSAITARRRDWKLPENVPVPPTPATEEANDNDHETSNETATEPRRSTRDRATPDWYDPCLNVMIVDNNDEDPATYEEAMMSPDSNKWQEAMKSEMGSMYDNKVWTLVDLPDSRKAVENKWIFKRKTDADGNILSIKLDLSQRVSDKFKVLTTMRLSHL